MFKVGDKVAFKAKLKGKEVTHVGTVVEVVPPNNYPSKYKGGFNKGAQVGRRNHESYFVEKDSARKPSEAFVWPRVSTLEAYVPPAPKTKKPATKKAQGSAVHAAIAAAIPNTEWIICLDSSASIRDYRLDEAILQTYRSEIEALRSVAKFGMTMKPPRVSLYTFGELRSTYSRESLVKCIFKGYEVSAVPTTFQYNPNGNTPMFDCIRKAIDEAQDPHTAYVLHVITDGEENDSTVDARHLGQLLRQAKATGRWSFALMLPRGHYKNAFLSRFAGVGVSAEDILEWETTEAGLRAAAVTTNKAVQNYGAARAMGQSAVNGFYQTDASQVTADQLAALHNLSATYTLYEVQQEAAIKDFIEGKTKKDYVIGSAYYQLMKKEKKVQSYKNILLREKRTGAVYGGADARRIIGIPVGKEAAVEPGNHANFDIFIESTSVNRILPRGSKVLHDTAMTPAQAKQPTWDHTQAQQSRV